MELLKEFFLFLPFITSLNWIVRGFFQKIVFSIQNAIALVMFAEILAIQAMQILNNYMPIKTPTGKFAIYLCTLSLIPTHYLYIYAMTHGKLAWKNAVAAAPIVFVIPAFQAISENVVLLGLFIFITAICICSLKILYKYRQELKQTVSNVTYLSPDMLIRSTYLIAILPFLESFQLFFLHNDTFRGFIILFITSVCITIFSSFLFYSYIEHFSASFSVDVAEDKTCEEKDNDILGKRLDNLMNEKKLYLKPDLSISDLAKEAGSCRTYVSNYLNNIKKQTFYDYVNIYRIRYAINLKEKKPDTPCDVLAAESGYTNETTFRRNYNKYKNELI